MFGRRARPRTRPAAEPAGAPAAGSGYPHLDHLLPVQRLLRDTGLYEEGVRVGPADLDIDWDDWEDLLEWPDNDIAGRLRDAARRILTAADGEGTCLPDACLLLPVPQQPGHEDPWAALPLSGAGEVGVAMVDMITMPGW